MNNRRLHIFVLAVAIVLLGPAENGIARTWLVSKEAASPLTTIQRALELSQNGDSILVAPGTYNEDIDFLGKGVVLKSENGPEVTILDGAGQDSSIVIFRNRESRVSVLEGFTLVNGVGTRTGGLKSGGAIICLSGSPTIRGNHFTGNHANFGGAIAVQMFTDDSSTRPAPQVQKCAFIENFADFPPGNGGAINVSGFVGDVDLDNNAYSRNVAGGDGGAIATYMNTGSISIAQSTFDLNTASDQGGAMFAFGVPQFQLQATIRYSLFSNNAAFQRESAFGSGGAVTLQGFNGSVDHNTFVGNSSQPTSPCGGGGVRLIQTSIVSIRDNVFANNHDCGLICRYGADARFGPNLFWNNTPTDVLTGVGECKESWLQLMMVADPEFCLTGPNPYLLASTSPAFAATGPMGAFPTPGCTGTPVISTTWGGIKAMFR